MSEPSEVERALLRLLARAARGPKRDGTFALWLAVRVALDLTAPDRPAERGHRRRVQALERRCSSLTLPPPLRRALQGTLTHLREYQSQSALVALTQLVAPARETLGPETAEVLRQALDQARARVAASAREK